MPIFTRRWVDAGLNNGWSRSDPGLRCGSMTKSPFARFERELSLPNKHHRTFSRLPSPTDHRLTGFSCHSILPLLLALLFSDIGSLCQPCSLDALPPKLPESGQLLSTAPPATSSKRAMRSPTWRCWWRILLETRSTWPRKSRARL